MARGDIGNANSAVVVSSFAVEVYTGAVWKNLCSLDGDSRIRSLSLSYDHDSGRWTGQADIINLEVYRDANKSLDPGHTSSYNPGGVPLLGAYHQVKITLAKGGVAGIVFEGYVGPSSLSGMEDLEGEDILGVNFVGIMQPYVDYWIDKEQGRTYSETYISAATNALNQILADYGFAQNIIVEDDPVYYLDSYTIGDTNIYDAITRPVQSIGYILMEKYYAASGAFKPTIIDPNRSDTTPDVDLAGSITTLRTTYTEASVRTHVKVVYRDRTTGKECACESKDDTAKAKYGIPAAGATRLHRYMRLVEEEGSVIDTRAEAMLVCDAALHDLSSPCPEVEVHVPWLCLGIEGGDYVSVTTNTETVEFGVTEIAHTISEPGDLYGSTTLRGTISKRVGCRKYWYSRGREDWIGQQDRTQDQSAGTLPERISNIELEAVWGENEDGSAAPILHVRAQGTSSWNTNGYRFRYKLATLYDSGTATGGSTTTLQDSGAGWTANALMGKYIRIGTATRGGADQTRRIISNTTTALIMSEALTTAASNGESYVVLTPTTDWTVVSTDRYPFVQIKGLPEGGYVVVEAMEVPYGTNR